MWPRLPLEPLGSLNLAGYTISNLICVLVQGLSNQLSHFVTLCPGSLSDGYGTNAKDLGNAPSGVTGFCIPAI